MAPSSHARPIVFLDIDGVLNNLEWFYFNKRRGESWENYRSVSPDLVHELNKIVYWTGADVVLSSTWRLHYDELRQVQALLDRAGFNGLVVGMTPTRYEAEKWLKLPKKTQIRRGHEIEAWLQRFARRRPPFVILDDDSDMEHLLPHLVKTCTFRGLQYQDVERAIQLINAQYESANTTRGRL